jgi:hypothetical protein
MKMAWEEEVTQIDENTVELNKPVKETKNNIMNEQETENWIFAKQDNASKVCALLYGKDGTAKSGIVLDYPLKKDEKMIILDLDGGCLPIAMQFHSEKLVNGQIIIKNPISYTDDYEIDYLATMKKVRAVCVYLRDNYKKQNVKVVCVDGLSTLLKYCEFQTRTDKHVLPDGGMTITYWKNRMHYFVTTLETIRSLNCDRFFISHEDFIIGEDAEIMTLADMKGGKLAKNKVSSVVLKTNQMMFQKLRCDKKKLGKAGMIYTVETDKMKSNPGQEGKVFNILEIKDNGEYVWNAKDLYKVLV